MEGARVNAMQREAEWFDWLDAAKGAGIALVVIGHIWTSGIVRDTIYAFHMPLFFILGGYVARPRPMRVFAERQFWALAVPYAAFLLALMLADPLIEHARGHLPRFSNWETALRAMLLGGSELNGPLTIFWFVPCLLAARLLQNMLASFWPSPRDLRWATTMAVTVLAGVWVGERSDFSPLGLLSVPIALVFLWLGALWRTMGNDKGIVTVAVLVSLAAIVMGRIAPLNMKAGDYGVAILSLPLALAMSLGLCGSVRIIPSWCLAPLGRRSLVIMFLHVPVIHYLRPYFEEMWLLVLAILFPVISFSLLSRIAWGRRYFLGNAP